MLCSERLLPFLPHKLRYDVRFCLRPEPDNLGRVKRPVTSLARAACWQSAMTGTTMLHHSSDEWNGVSVWVVRRENEWI